MYQIKCDEYILYDPRHEDLRVLNPKCTVEENKSGNASFTILKSHRFYDRLQKMKSVFEFKQDGQVVFRGRMTNDSKDFSNRLAVDIEGVLCYLNDSIIEPYDFPSDFPEAANSENIIEYFLNWLITEHNAQVNDWQQLHVGRVTVSDSNNYIARSSKNYSKTWDTLKSALLDKLDGYLIVRYEDDGNYIDYVSEYELTNTQPITFGQNLLDITSKSDATDTFSAILPLGAEITLDDGKTKQILTIESLPDGDLSDDIVKRGKYIYSKAAVETYGWVCVPIADSTFKDVTVAINLQNKAVEYLAGVTLLTGSTTLKAVDLGFTDDEIQKFKPYRNVLVNSPHHNLSNAVYRLTKLTIDLLNPQNTSITIGNTARTLTDINRQEQDKIQVEQNEIREELKQNKDELNQVHNTVSVNNTQLIQDCNAIILEALTQYVQTSNFEEYSKTIATQFDVIAGEISYNFTTTTEQIKNVNGDLQSKFTELYNYIKINNGVMTFGSSESVITLVLDNDRISFRKNGVEFGWWNGDMFRTGNIYVDVDEKAQFGNFAFEPRPDGSLTFNKVR